MLRLYDTRTRQVEPITPAGSRAVRMYTCGPATDRYAHVGNLRSYLLSDLVRRVAERQGLRAVVCQNIMDVGHPVDDTAAGAAGGAEIARFYEAAFRADTLALNMRAPEHTPRASESVELVVELIARLIEKGHAYAVADGSVFFAAASFPSYGEISGNRVDQLTAGHGAEGVDGRKRFHADWALWKASGGEMTWEAPWGRGFPGRHIECSAMSLRFLGERFDLHTGGVDLRFPHHEDERAQSNAATGHEVVGHWVHSEHLLFDGRPMATSNGNVVLLSDVAEAGLDPLAVRLALMEHHYRRPMNLTWDSLHAADRTLRQWRRRVAEWAESPSRPIEAGHAGRIEQALDDDLDTPLALRLLRDLERDESVPPGSRLETFLHLDHILGLDLSIDIGRAPVLGVKVADTPGGQA